MSAVATPVSTPATTPVAAPASARRSGLSAEPSARTSPGRMSPATTNPATTGTSTPSRPKVWPEAGRAPKTGIPGIGPRTVPIGETFDPVPMANPGPTSHATAHPTRSGRNAS